MEAIPTNREMESPNADAVATINNFINFMFINLAIRVLMLPNKTNPNNQEPWFVSKEICDAISLENSRQVTSRLDDDEKDVISLDTPGGIQKVSIINESGLYSLVLGSRKKEARAFKRFVTHEILPSIRKYGVYATDSTIAEYQKNPLRIQQLLTEVESHKSQARAHEQQLAEKQNIIANYASVMFYEEETKRANSMQRSFEHIDLSALNCFNLCYILELDETVEIDGIQRKLYKYGRTEGVLQRSRDHKTEYKNSRLISVYVVSNSRMCENRIRDWLIKYGLHMKTHVIGGKKKEEIFYTKPELNILDIDGIFKNECMPDAPLDKMQVQIDNLTAINKKDAETIQTLKSKNAFLHNQIKDLRRKCNRKFQRHAALKQKHEELQQTHKKLELEYSCLENLASIKKWLIKSCTGVVTSSSKDAQAPEPEVESISNVENSKAVAEPVSTTPTPDTHKVCTSCNAVFSKSHYPLWSLTNKPRHTCVECSAKCDAEYVDMYDTSKPGRTCTTCGKLKNDSGFLKDRKLNECSDCINQYRRAHDRQRAFDKYVAAPSDEAYEPDDQSNIEESIVDETINYKPETHKVCIECKSIFANSEFPKWSTGAHRHTCADCSAKADAAYVDDFDKSQEGRGCTTCGRTKNTSSLKNKCCSNCTKECDEHRKLQRSFNTNLNKYELKLYGEHQKRRCTKCKIVRDFSSYHKAKGGTFGLSSCCKSCKPRNERKSDYAPKHIKTTHVLPNVNT